MDKSCADCIHQPVCVMCEAIKLFWNEFIQHFKEDVVNDCYILLFSKCEHAKLKGNFIQYGPYEPKGEDVKQEKE